MADQTTETLLDAIQACIVPGLVIISDTWTPYHGVEAMIGMIYNHQAVNHTENFVNSTTLAHAQTIESSWQDAE